MESKCQNTCVACKETSEQVALHYNRMMCNGCRAFFKRTVQGKVKFSDCKSDGQCVIEPSTRKLCKSCRFDACQRAGVDINKVQQLKDEGVDADANPQDPHFYPNMHIDGGLRLISSSFLPQPSYPQFQISAHSSQISPSMYSTAYGVNGASSIFNPNLGPVTGHMSNLHVVSDSQSQLHLSKNHPTSSLDQSLQLWAPGNTGSLFPGTSTDFNRLTSTFHLPYLSSSQRQTAASLYIDIAKNAPMMDQRFLYQSNVSANQDIIMPYPGAFSQTALSNCASYPGFQSLANAWNDGYGRYTIPSMNMPQSYHNDISQMPQSYHSDTSNMPKTRDPVTNDARTIKSELASSLILNSYSVDSAVTVNRHEAIINDKYVSGNSQHGDVNVKEEIAEPDLEATHVRENPESRIEVSAESRAVNESTQGMPPRSMSRHEGVSGRSNSFMMDTLLKPSEHISLKQHHDDARNICVPQFSAQASYLTWAPHPYNTSLAHFKSTNKIFAREEQPEMTQPIGDAHDVGLCTTIRPRDNRSASCDPLQINTWPIAGTEASDGETHSGQNNEDKPDVLEVGQSTLKHADVDTYPYDSSEDVDVDKTDQETCSKNIIVRSKKSRSSEQESCQEMKILENESSQVISEWEKEKTFMSFSGKDAEDTSRNVNLQHTHPSLGLDITLRVNSSDSGLGNSGQNLWCEQSDIKSEKAETDNAANVSKAQKVNECDNENVPVTPSKKRKRLSQTENNNNKLAKICRTKLMPATFPAKHRSRNGRLTEIQKNRQKKQYKEYYPEDRSLPSVSSSTDSSSDGDASAARSIKIRPQLTSTPVARRKNDIFRRFRKLMCGFAKFYQNEDAHSSCTTTDKLSSSFTTTDKLSLSIPADDTLSSSFNTVDKLSCSVTTVDKLSSSFTTVDKLSSSFNKADKLSSSWHEQPYLDSKPGSSSSLNEKSINESGSPVRHSDKMEKIEDLQQELMRKVRSVDTYSMAEFKADVCRLNSLIQDARTQGKL